MAGIIVILLISWLLLYFVEKENIGSLGLFPINKRLKQFIIGFIISTLLCFVVQAFESMLAGGSWSVNENYNLILMMNKFGMDLRSVVTEELMFRGVILYILIKRIGVGKAIVISAIAFGVYHWFSFGIFGDLIPMIFIFIGTGLMGYAWALAFSRTGSIFMPIGFHIGLNFTLNTIFSKGQSEDGLLILKGGGVLDDWFSLVSLFGIPIVILLIVNYFVTNENSRPTKRN